MTRQLFRVWLTTASGAIDRVVMISPDHADAAAGARAIHPDAIRALVPIPSPSLSPSAA